VPAIGFSFTPGFDQSQTPCEKMPASRAFSTALKATA
jgi:hypothetical protein